MCGIFGYYSTTPLDIIDLGYVGEYLAHRGPDFCNVRYGENFGFLHTRLSIIDLEEKSNQPFFDSSNNLTLVFNGEIYNYRQLRNDLSKLGFSFHTNSDTEVLLKLYIAYGSSCVEKLRGMFAFAIYDGRDNSVFFARDPFGKKPLYHCMIDGVFYFSSEIYPLTLIKNFDKKINNNQLSYYLYHNHCSSGNSLFDTIDQLPPGNWCKKDNLGRTSTHKYYHLNRNQINISFNDAASEFERIFLNSVSRRLVGDVEIGSFLSGGVDSSSICVALRSLGVRSHTTYSVSFNEDSFDESNYANLVAKELGFKNKSILINEITHDDLEIIVSHSSEPLADASMVPTYFLSKYASQDVKVVLAGDGADEIFGGYPTYTANTLANYLNKVPTNFIDNLFDLACKFLSISTSKSNFRDHIQRFKYGFNLPFPLMHDSWRHIFTIEEISELQPESKYDIKSFVNDILHESFNNKYSNLSQALYSDLTNYLPNDMLVKVDRMSMANSLEVRSPFLDTELVEFVFSLPDRYKINFLTKKYILKKYLSKTLPREITHRKKAGFNAPIGNWLKGNLGKTARESIDTNFINAFGFNSEFINRLFKDHLSCAADNSYRIWSLYVLSIWHRQYFNENTILFR